MPKRIRVLLIDDKPRFMWDRLKGIPRFPKKIARHFELLWIQTPWEARWIIDAFEALRTRAPHELTAAGFPPEILIFDYALTEPIDTSRDCMAPSHPLRCLNDLLDKHGLSVSSSLDPEQEVPSTGAVVGKDRMGCYIGGVFKSAFSEYPCGAVPTTAHVDVADSDAAFFEWLLEPYFDEAFRRKVQTPRVRTLLHKGLEDLRERFVTLAAAEVIRVELDPVESLSLDPEAAKERTVVFRSRFGRREIAVESLFADKLQETPNGVTPFAREARSWAQRVREGQFKGQTTYFIGQGHSEYHEAKELAEMYWSAYNSDAASMRDELSTLLAYDERDDGDEERIDELCSKMGIAANHAKRAPDDAEVKAPGFAMPALYQAARTPTVTRWAALLIAIRAEENYRKARAMEVIAPYVRPEDLATGELLLDDIGSRVEDEDGYEQILRAAADLDAIDTDAAGLKLIKLPARRPALVDDVLTALDPLPGKVLLWQHRGRSKNGIRQRMPAVITNRLKMLGRARGDGWGPLGVSLSDVLSGVPFSCKLCREALSKNQDPPQHPKRPEKGAGHGVRYGEGHLLRIYAEEDLAFASGWPDWLARAP